MTPPPARNGLAIAATCAAMAAFAVNDSMMKLAGSLLPTGETMALRSVLALIGLLLVLGLSRGVPRRADLLHPVVLLRSALEMGVATAYLSALPHMPLTNALAVFLTAPLMSSAAAPFVLKERVGWRRWAAVGVGFIGVLLVIRPGMSGFNIWTLAVIAAAACAVTRDFASRRLPAHIPSTTATIGALGAALVGGLLLGLGEAADWRPPDSASLWPILLAVIAIIVGNQLVIVGFRHGDASVVSPYRYTILAWGLLMGFAMFGETPDGPAIAGITLIAGAGLYTLHRERVRGVVRGPATPPGD